MNILLELLIAGGVMGVIDFAWLGFIAKNFYQGEIGKILLKKPKVLPAVLFYVIYVIGVVLLVVEPALDKSSLPQAMSYGALLGLVSYGTYDLTNLATVKGFNAKVVVIDLMWGTFITAATASITYLVAQAWIWK